jgi:SAM-dependent methyltransferase
MICRSCLSLDNFICILDLGQMPLAGAFLNTKDIVKEKKYPLKVYSCVSCGLVQFLNHIDPNILFNQYSFSSSTVFPLVSHFEKLALEISKFVSPGSSILEIGCNDGILLSPLSKMGFDVEGVDMSVNIIELARTKNLKAEQGKFDLKWLDSHPEYVNKFDLVTCSNSFPHNADQESLTKAFNLSLKPDGILLLEVMYAGDLKEKLQWDTLYHEHLTFHSLISLQRLLSRNGLQIFDAELISMHGGSLRIWASKLPKTSSHRMNTIIEKEIREELSNSKMWVEFGVNALKTIETVSTILTPLARNYKIGSYGAAGKATMWMNACGLDFIEYVVDASPLRYGKLMPGTHNPIISPEEFRQSKPDIVLVTAWNYLNEIKKNENWYTGHWCVPLPTLAFS